MQHRMHLPRVQTLLPYALLATAVVVALPILVVVALSAVGLPEPQMILAGVLGVAFSIGAAALGATWWIKRPESVDVSFGELMLWRFFRRHRAERTIDRNAVRLGLSPAVGAASDLTAKQRLGILHKLAGALEAKDPYTGGHSRRVERHAYRTACALLLSSDDIEDLRLAASLHDVGKIRIPDRVLRKPDALDAQEWDMVREHSELGAAMVAPAASEAVVSAVLHHHEAWDGSGYPHGLSGEGIPLFARIIAVADTYDALTSARPYKAAIGRKDAVELLETGAGYQFDPVVVEAFVTTLPTALPAAGALLVFATPTAAARKVSAWLRSVSGGSVASAAGTAGVAAIIGTAGVTGAFGGGAPAAPAPSFEVAPAAVAPVAEGGAEVDRSGKKKSAPAVAVPGRKVAARNSKQKQSPAPVSAAEVAEPSSSGSGKPSAAAPSGGQPEGPAGPPTPGADEPATGHKPPGDPQPEEGRDCDADEQGQAESKGKGRSKHCD